MDFGVIGINFLLGKYSNDIPALFWLSMITCGILEYFTSFIMEKLFNARWWDYSSRKFNINGRICLETLIPFGIAGVITVCFTNPFFVMLIEMLPTIVIHAISISSIITIGIDCVFCIYILAGLKSTETDLSSPDDTETISSYVQDKAEEMAMQFEADIRHDVRKRKLKRQRKILHLKLRLSKKITNEYNETIRRTNELKKELSNVKLSSKQLTDKLKNEVSKKSFLHKRLMEAYPTFEVTEKWKSKYNNRNNKES